MSKYYIKVVESGGLFMVLANLPSGVFASGRMDESQALRLAETMGQQIKGENKRRSWWKRVLGWWKGDQPMKPPEIPTCPRHPNWKVEWAGNKWVCSFCRKELKGNVEIVCG